MDSTNERTEQHTQELLTKQEVAKRLKVGTRTIDLWVRQGIIPRIKINTAVRFDWRAVMKKLNAQEEGATA